MGIKAIVCMPDGAPISKVEATKALGAEVCLVKGAYDDAYNYACQLQQETGMTFSDFVNKQKIEEAAALLLYTEYSDTQISTLLAFSSQSYFIKVFRKYMGTTPKQYKKQYNIPDFTGR